MLGQEQVCRIDYLLTIFSCLQQFEELNNHESSTARDQC